MGFWHTKERGKRAFLMYYRKSLNKMLQQCESSLWHGGLPDSGWRPLSCSFSLAADWGLRQLLLQYSHRGSAYTGFINSINILAFPSL